MHSASSSLNKRFLSRFHSLWFIHYSTLSLTVSLTVLHILGLLHRIILFGKIFTCHVITILPLPTPLHHRIVAIHQSFHLHGFAHSFVHACFKSPMFHSISWSSSPLRPLD